ALHQCDHARLRRDVRVRRSRTAARSLGDRRLHPRAATEPARRARRCAGGQACRPGARAMSQRALLIGSAAGFIACAAGLLIDPGAVLASYLTAWFAVSAIPIGAPGVLFTTYLVRGGWTQDLQQPLSRAALAIPVAGLLFVPVLIGMSAIYP